MMATAPSGPPNSYSLCAAGSVRVCQPLRSVSQTLGSRLARTGEILARAGEALARAGEALARAGEALARAGEALDKSAAPKSDLARRAGDFPRGGIDQPVGTSIHSPFSKLRAETLKTLSKLSTSISKRPIVGAESCRDGK